MARGVAVPGSGQLVWVTGARGFIGQHLVQWCAKLGHVVCGIGHGPWSPMEFSRRGLREWINGDIGSSNLRELCVRSARPQTIFHLAGGSSVRAAIANPAEDFQRTAGSTAALLEWVRQESSSTNVVVVSSAAVYGAGHEGQIGEDASLAPYSPYGYNKMIMETLCRSYGATYGIRSVVARLFSVYGNGLRKQLMWDLCCKLSESDRAIELDGNGDELRDWVDVSDAVSVLASLSGLAAPDVPTVNVGTGIGTSVRQIAGLLLSAWGQGSAIQRQLRFTGKERAGDPRSLIANPALLARYGHRCRVPVAQGAPDFVRWFRAADQSRA